MIQKSESTIRRLLRASPDLVYETNELHQTPLHVSVYWPQGLKLLLQLATRQCQSIIDAEDSNGLTPIHYAIALQQSESVSVLLKEGSGLDLENTWNYFPREQPNNRRLDRRVFDILCGELACQRRAMLLYALDQLPEAEIKRFDLRSTTMLQENAYQVVMSMKSHGVTIPVAYERVRPGSIYHSLSMSDTLAQSLFDVGFTTIGSIMDGHTPLMINNFSNFEEALRLISWYEQKQLDLHAVVPVESSIWMTTSPQAKTSNFRLIHLLAGELGRGRHETYDDGIAEAVWSDNLPQFLPLMRKIMSTSPKDSCQCYCAPGGCNTVSIYTKEWILQKEALSSFHIQQDFILETLLDLVLVGKDIQRSFLRVFTFQRLGMQHTCCQIPFDNPLDTSKILRLGKQFGRVKLMDPAEVNEIQEEDSYSAERLEELMNEVDDTLQDDTWSLKGLWDWWNTRMDEIDQEKEDVDVDDFEAMLDIGILFGD